jgi:flagellar protein FlaG
MQVEATQSGSAYQPGELPFDSASSPQESEPPAPPAEEKKSSVIQFREDKVSGRMMMTLVDAESGEVVRQIPPEELVDISRVLGLLFDRVA